MWDERYSADGFVFGTEPADFLTRHTDLFVPGERALVVADGEGRNSVFLAEQGLEVTAMDASPVGLAKASALAQERGVSVEFHQSDIMEWNWIPESFDLVVAVFIQFAGPADRTVIFDGMKRTLRSGGRVLVHGYTPKQLEYKTGGPPTEENLYTVEILRDAFGDLSIERLEAYEAELTEGTGHVGRSALVDLIATKV